MQYDLDKHNFDNPDPWLALALDRSTYFEPNAKAALVRNNATKSRTIVLPVMRPIARLSIVLVKIVRLVITSWFTSSKTLHKIIVWGMKHFVSPDANYLIFRHFHIGSQILQFLGDNISVTPLKSHPLKPLKIEDFGNNTFVQHDLNIYNFIIQVNAQLQQHNKEIEPLPLDKINFSAIQDVDSQLPKMPKRRTNFLDLQSAIEIYTPLFAVFLSDKDFWRASNSLQLDETMALYVAKLFGKEGLIGLVNNRHPLVPLSTMEAGFRLMLHGLDAENLYGFIKHMKEEQNKLGR